jgi:hypothetical protein
MHKRFKMLDMMLIAHDQAPEVLPPRVGALNDPAVAISSELSSILMRCDGVVLPAWDNRFNGACDQQRPRPIAVISAVGNQALRLAGGAPPAPPSGHVETIERPLEEGDFRRGRLLHAYSERSTLAICQNHKLCPLAACGLAHTAPPFLAETNMPSTKHSFQRILPASLSWSSSARHRRNRTPLAAHPARRLWTALFEPYRRGNALQGAPVQRIDRIPSKHCRSLRRGRPPRGGGIRGGRCCAMTFHCLSVTARQAMGDLHGLVSYWNHIICQPVSG